MPNVSTQLLQRVEKKLDKFSCGATPDIVREHTEILNTIPVINEKLDRILSNQDEQFKRLNKVEKEVVIIDTQRKTERGMLLFISGIIGALAGWFSRHL